MKTLCVMFAFAILLMGMSVAQQPKAGAAPLERNSSERADPRMAKLKAAVEAVYGATLDSQDVDKIADATHQKSIELAGGREQFKAGMARILDFSRLQFESLTWKIDGPIQIKESDGKVFGVVTRTLEGVTKRKDRLVQTGAIVGISVDNGHTWKFVNGTNFAKLFPEYVTVIQIGKERSYINGVEQ